MDANANRKNRPFEDLNLYCRMRSMTACYPDYTNLGGLNKR